MAKCFFCKEDTRLYHAGSPVCIACSDVLDSGKKPPKREAGEEESCEGRADVSSGVSTGSGV